jgi:hypothetical protein
METRYRSREEYINIFKVLIKDYRDAIKRKGNYEKYDYAINYYLKGLSDSGMKKEEAVKIYGEARELVLKEEKDNGK